MPQRPTLQAAPGLAFQPIRVECEGKFEKNYKQKGTPAHVQTAPAAMKKRVFAKAQTADGMEMLQRVRGALASWAGVAPLHSFPFQINPMPAFRFVCCSTVLCFKLLLRPLRFLGSAAMRQSMQKRALQPLAAHRHAVQLQCREARTIFYRP